MAYSNGSKLTVSLACVFAGACLLMAGNGAPAAPAAGAGIEIDGQRFTFEDVVRKKPGALFQARNTLFEAERKLADEFINDYLLEREAKKQNLSVDQLLAQQVYNKLPKDPSEEALRVYYDGLDTKESFEAVRDKIVETIKQRRMAKAKTAYVEGLRAKAAVSVRLAPPRAVLALANTPMRGPSAAAVTIIEYADYECPYCQQIQPVLERLEKEYAGKIAFGYKDVPLPMHASAQKAAEASHCAGAQGKYWEYHDILYTTKQVGPGSLREHARALKLDQAAFDRCLDSGVHADRIKADLAEAQAIGLPGTPGFFVNGRFLTGAVDYDTLRQAIEEELRLISAVKTETANAGRR